MRLSKEALAEIARRYRNGEKVASIATQFDISDAYVVGIARRDGAPMRRALNDLRRKHRYLSAGS